MEVCLLRSDDTMTLSERSRNITDRNLPEIYGVRKLNKPIYLRVDQSMIFAIGATIPSLTDARHAVT